MVQGHHYRVYIIHLAVVFVMESLNSFRGATKNFALLGQYFNLASPSYSSIRQWVLRVGFYELCRSRENRDDWLFIIDMTLELGPRKCLLILGISQVHWQTIVNTTQGELSYEDMEILGLEIMNQTKGEMIHQVLEEVAQRVGRPLQIVSDHGGDLKKGVNLYQTAHPEVILTYDITHQCARLLKAELELDETYQVFASRCARSRQQLQQSPLSFLRPPTQRTKARYFNIDTLLEWTAKVTAYEKRQEFSLINPCFCLDQSALDGLKPHLSAVSLTQLQLLKDRTFPHRQAFTQALRAALPIQHFSEVAPVALQKADLGRRYFEQKLGWLKDYQIALTPYHQMLALVRTLQQQLKQQGLTDRSKTDFIEQTSALQLSPRLSDFKAKLLDYLERETATLPSDKPWLGSSDMIESLFGKYKIFSAKSPLKHMGHLILTLPLLTTKLTAQLIKTVMETVSFDAVENWYRKVFGPSPLAKRRAVFQGKTVNIESA